MRFPLTELADALDATISGPEMPVPAQVIDGLTNDSRAVRPGQLFAAVRAERDGHEFVAAALRAGAAAVLVDHPVTQAGSALGPALVVADVGEALAELARHARAALPDRVVGITGSVGKTTTKDLLAAVLSGSFVTAASERSFNNEIGVPLTLCNAPDDVQAVVVEMGARGVGHIELLCSMAHPTVGVVTTVQAVHTEMMGGVEEIARNKGELIEALPDDGLAVLNAAVPLVAGMASRSTARVLTFGDGGEVHADDVVVGGDLRTSFVLRSPWGSAPVGLGIRGAHNVDNALAAASVGLGLGMDLDRVVAGLASSDSSPWRMDLRTAPSGALVLNDSYNAAPASVAAALRSLRSLDARRRIAVLGLMAELGDSAGDEHRRIADLAGELDIELIAVGTDLYGPDPVADVAAAVVALVGVGDGDAVLVKGSRVVGLERLAAVLLE